MKRMLWPLICALLLTLAGCNGSGADETPPLPGAYTERIVELTGYYSMLGPAVGPDGTLYFAARQKYNSPYVLCAYADPDAPPEVTRLSVSGDIAGLSVAPDRRLALLVYPKGRFDTGISAGMSATPTVIWMDVGAAVTELSLPDAQAADYYNTKAPFVALEGMECLIGGVNGVERYARNGERLAVYGSAGGVFTYADGSVYILESGGVNAYALDTGEKSPVYAPPASEGTDGAAQRGAFVTGGLGFNNTQVFAARGEVYMMTPEAGLVRLTGGAPAAVMDLRRFVIGDPSATVIGYAMTADGTVAALVDNLSGDSSFDARMGRFSGEQPFNLCVYTWDESVDTTQNAVLTVSAVHTSPLLDKAVSEFYKTHPGVNVKVTTLLSYTSNTARGVTTDEIRLINADILAGKGADVMLLDGLNYRIYAQKGHLTDIGALAAELGVMDNIVDGMRVDGKVYAVPISFSVATLWGGKDVIAASGSLEDIAALITSAPDGAPAYMGCYTPRALMDRFLPESMASMRDAQGTLTFTSGAFERFLDALNVIYTRGMAPAGESGPLGYIGGDFNYTELAAMQDGVIATTTANHARSESFLLPYSVTGGEAGAWTLIPGLDGAGRGYTPYGIMGINARCAEPELAADFIRTLFSEPVQQFYFGNRLPAARAALEQRMAETLLDSSNIPSGIRFLGRDGLLEAEFDIIRPTGAFVEDFIARISTLDTPLLTDEAVMNVLYEETTAFFEGRRDAAETAQAVQQRLAQYMAE